jgi:putative flippase GtrA
MTDGLLDRQALWQRGSELIRFIATGSLSVALNLLIVAVSTEWLGLHYLLSLGICFIIVTVLSFCLNRWWTFRKVEGGVPIDLARYCLIALGHLLVSLGACAICVEIFHLHYLVAMAMLSIAFVPITFLLHRYWSFGLR